MTFLVPPSLMDWAVSLVVCSKGTNQVSGFRTLQDGYNVRPNIGASLRRLGGCALRRC